MAFEITTNPIRGVEAQQGSGHYGIFDHGAHIYSWQPDGQAPVLFVSRDAVYGDDTSVRGGVPVIFPWFGGGASGDLSPLTASSGRRRGTCPTRRTPSIATDASSSSTPSTMR